MKRLAPTFVASLSVFTALSCGATGEILDVSTEADADGYDLRQYCGNNRCDRRETCSSCSRDCGPCAPAPIDAGKPDAGAPKVDAGAPVVDAGTPVVDAGKVDAGTPVIDAGKFDAGKADAGNPVVDAGTPVIDAGTPVVDAGNPVVDAGTPVVDAGPAPLKAAMRYTVNGATVTYTSISTGPIVRTEWDLNATGATTSAEYIGTTPAPQTYLLGTATVPNNYAVKLTVIDAAGNRDSVFEAVSFGTAYLGPKAHPHTSVFGLSMRVYGYGSVGSDLSYAWNFGDGTTATGVEPPMKTYAAAGTYTLTLTVTDSQGRTHTQSRLVSVAAAPAGARGPHNTGVPAGTVLKPVAVGGTLPPGMAVSGVNITINGTNGGIPAADANGCNYSGLEFKTFVDIRAANVTICRSLFTGRRFTQAEDDNNLSGPRMLLISNAAAVNFKLVDSTIRPAFPDARLDATGGRRFTLERVDISGTVDGLKVWSNATDATNGASDAVIKDSYIHDLRYDAVAPYFLNVLNSAGKHRVEGSHSDGIQHQGGRGTVITGTTIVGANNAAVQVTQDYYASTDLTFTGNHVDGGGCSINVSGGSGAFMTGMRVQNNFFGKNMRSQPGTTFGIAPYPDASAWSTTIGVCGVIYTFGDSDLDTDANISGNTWETGGTLTRSPRVGLYRVGG